MDDLVTWLRAQLDEDERVARGAAADQSPPWKAMGDDGESFVSTESGGVIRDGDCGGRSVVSVHIARHDPACVSREVAAKRRIIAQYETARDQARDPVSAKNYEMTRLEQGALGDVLRLLALPYADRPGYREEWRP